MKKYKAFISYRKKFGNDADLNGQASQSRGMLDEKLVYSLYI
jgi:hypothetical protein